jgi:hypothetical protein
MSTIGEFSPILEGILLQVGKENALENQREFRVVDIRANWKIDDGMQDLRATKGKEHA